MNRAVARTDSDTSARITSRGLSSHRRTVTGANGMPSKRMLRRIVRPESIRPRLDDLTLVRQPAVQASGRAGAATPPAPSARSPRPGRRRRPSGLDALDDLLLQRHQRLEVLLQRLGEPGEHPGHASTQRGRIVLGALLRLPVPLAEPAQQHLLLGDGQVRVDLVPCCWEISRACPRCAAGRSRSAPVALALDPLAVLGEDDLVGQRGQVDLVGLLVQVVLLRQVLRLEESRMSMGLPCSWPSCGLSLGTSDSVKFSSAPSSDRSS